MDIRKEFEKLDEISEILRDEDTHWCDKRGMYINQRVFQDSTTGYLNGAWYAFQEQQKKIDDAFLENAKLKHVIDQVKLHNGSLGFRSMQRMIEELLK